MFTPYGKQNVDQADIDAVTEVLRSDFLTQGPVTPRFEAAVAAYTGARFAIAVNSATSALHIACLALDVGPGDRVWTTPITFVASSNAALYCGGQVDFVDIDSQTYNIDAEALAEKLVQAEKTGTLPKVVIPVHLAGQSCDMARIYALSQQYGFRIIEDASHGIGGRYKGEPIGNCRYSDITVFSFHPVKIITSAEGGMAMTNDAELSAKMARLRSHGITRDPAQMVGPSDGGWYYQQIELGFNYRMTDVHAALGLSQMAKLDDFVVARHVLANRYDELLANHRVRTPFRHEDNYSAFHIYVVRMPGTGDDDNRNAVFERMRKAGIGVNLHYIPIYRQPYYARFGYDRNAFPNAEAYYREAITIPLFPGLSPEQQDEIVHTLTHPDGYQTLF